MDGRLASLEAKVDSFIARMDERFLWINERFERMDQRFERLDERFRRMDERFERIDSRIDKLGAELRAAISGLKSTTIITGISAVLAIVIGVASFNATMLSSMVTAFESGKNTSAAQAEVKRQTEETAALLKQIQQQISSSPAKK
jgi:predicted RNase H-like nuclease (RuvC/YqgF family)